MTYIPRHSNGKTAPDPQLTIVPVHAKPVGGEMHVVRAVSIAPLPFATDEEGWIFE